MKLIKRLLFKNYLVVAIALIVIVGLSLIMVLNNYEPAPATNASVFIDRKDTNSDISEDLAVEPAEDAKPEEKPALEETTTPPSNTAGTLNCTDCSLAPVDKNNALPSSYTPSVMATGLAGNGSLTSAATSALRDLFNAARAKGITAEIISAHRSYATQETTFNYWVSTEVASGLSQAAAEAEANTYSARPGQSEHQLGTTVDLKCAGCGDFDSNQNAALYDFIESNAHLYGFAISYPKGQDALTGYTYEPWHIRFIGINLATKLFNTGYTAGNGVYLAQFLREL